jgi:hypothetical protein
MVFDLPRLEAFLARGEDMLAGVRVYASVALLRSERMACALRAPWSASRSRPSTV